MSERLRSHKTDESGDFFSMFMGSPSNQASHPDHLRLHTQSRERHTTAAGRVSMRLEQVHLKSCDIMFETDANGLSELQLIVGM